MAAATYAIWPVDLRSILQRAGLTEGSTTVPGEFVVEKAFVE